MTVRRETVLEVLRARAPRAIHVGEVCKLVGVSPRERAEVDEALDALVTRGLAQEMPGRRFRLRKRPIPPAPAARPVTPSDGDAAARGTLAGYYTGHPRGFGFVTTFDGGPDVFIPPGSQGAALHGDRVRVSARPSDRGREGAVVGVSERAVTRLGGLLRRSGRATWIEPDDPRLPGPMPVEGELAPGAKPGLQVVAEVVRYPRGPEETATVRIVEVLGTRGVTEVEVAKIKLREGIVEEFPEAVEREAAEVASRLGDRGREGREDLRGYDLVTIDPEDARDHDDAVWGERLPHGGFRLLVAIADVSHFVEEGSALDAEAARRGCSLYLPDRAIPMLPRALSSGVASLVPDEDRLALAVDVELDASGTVRRHRYIEGVMRSGARLTYGGVARALGFTGEPAEERAARDRRPLLEVLRDAAALLRERRLARGALDFELPEARVRLDERNEPIDVYRSRRDPGIRKAYSMVEELMLLANEVVAADLAGREVPTIYRVHGAPAEDRILAFSELASSLGHVLPAEATTNPRLLTAFLRQIAGTKEEPVLNFLLLRAMQQATYDTKNIGHFGLAAPHYLHFTSPIRRYPDLVVHRVLRGLLRGGRRDAGPLAEPLKEIAVQSSRMERRAMEVERDVLDLYRAVLMRPRLGEELEGTISSVVAHGLYCSLDSPFVDVLIPVDALGGDFYELDEQGLRLVGRHTGYGYMLGDRITVRIEDVSLTQRRIEGVPVLHVPSEPHTPQARRPRAAPSRRAPGPAARGARPQAGGRAQGRSSRGGPADREGRRRGGSERGARSEGRTRGRAGGRTKGKRRR